MTRRQPSLSKRLGVCLVEEPHVQSPASLLMLNKTLKKLDPTIFNWEEWLLFRTDYFNNILKEKGTICCVYCGKDNLQIDTEDKSLLATIDHKVPVSKGGEVYNINNLVPSCYKCNQNKGDKDFS